MLITVSDLARLKNVSVPAVSQRIKRGGLAEAVVEVDGKKLIHKDKALELWDMSRLGRPPVGLVDATEQPHDVATALVQATPSEAVPPLAVSKAKREFYLAELARLQVEQQSGELLAADAVKASAFAMGRAIREGLANLADRLSYELAGESDESVINKVLTDEHRQVLEELAKVTA